MAQHRREWGGSLHQTFRLLPTPDQRSSVFLGSDGATPEEVLARLPYERARAGSSSTGTPDPKRYRDGRHVYQLAGLLYEEEGSRLRVTELGKATYRWIGKISLKNSPVLGRHAAYALAVCQLRNPTGAGRRYSEDVEVFPFAFIWRAMLALDGKISSDELNRVLFRVTNLSTLDQAIEHIARCREDEADPALLGEETISGEKKNDRIIPWIALASFGWLLIADKRDTGGHWYHIRPFARELLQEATRIKRAHREFASDAAYAQYVSDAACLPLDVR